MTQAVDPAGVCRHIAVYHPGPAGRRRRRYQRPGPQLDRHAATRWNGGANDNWLPARVPFSPLREQRARSRWVSTRDLPIHRHVLVCDGYFARCLGGTTPNRYYWMSAWIDPDGTDGGPVLIGPNINICGTTAGASWRTSKMPGSSWKVYQKLVLGALNTVVGYGLVNDFKQAADQSSGPFRHLTDTTAGTSPATSEVAELPKVLGAAGFLLSGHPHSR